MITHIYNYREYQLITRNNQSVLYNKQMSHIETMIEDGTINYLAVYCSQPCFAEEAQNIINSLSARFPNLIIWLAMPGI